MFSRAMMRSTGAPQRGVDGLADGTGHRVRDLLREPGDEHALAPHDEAGVGRELAGQFTDHGRLVEVAHRQAPALFGVDQVDHLHGRQ